MIHGAKSLHKTDVAVKRAPLFPLQGEPNIATSKVKSEERREIGLRQSDCSAVLSCAIKHSMDFLLQTQLTFGEWLTGWNCPFAGQNTAVVSMSEAS